jgi:ribose transport system substrate-binding protein
MGYQGVRALRAFVEDDQKTVKEMFPKCGEEGGDIYDTGLKIIVPDDSKKLDEVKFPPNIEFMKLAPFKEWLNKYNLEGS